MKNVSLKALLPVMFGFFVMGFVDIIGMAINYMKNDFSALTDTTVNLISSSCFLWFFILAIPTGLLMNRIGRRRTVVISFAFTFVAMLIPSLHYSFTSMLVAFSLLGIGNTILQTALNPLVAEIVSPRRLTSSLTMGQFIKAVSSFLGPILTTWLSGTIWGWEAIFPVYAAVSLISAVWLGMVKIDEKVRPETSSTSLWPTLHLLGDKRILMLFLSIFVVVGVDVCMNISFPKYLMERFGFSLSDATVSNSLYFFARTFGAFVGGLLLLRVSEKYFYLGSVLLALAGLICMLFSGTPVVSYIAIVIFGLGYANIYSIIFSVALKCRPDRTNEISALLIVAFLGGAICPPLAGLLTDAATSQLAAIVLMALLWLYLLIPFRLVKNVSDSAKAAE